MGGTWTIRTGERGRRGQRKDANPNNNNKQTFKKWHGVFCSVLTKGGGGYGGLAFGNLWEGMMPVGEGWGHCPGENRLLFFAVFFLIGKEERMI